MRAHGLRRTQPRISVLAILEPGVGHHLSVDEIYRLLVDSTPAPAQPPDLATVYRTVTILVEHGLLHALTIDGGVTMYGPGRDPHHHAVCTSCGAVSEIPAQQPSAALKKAPEASAFALSDQHGLTLRGVCPKCQAVHK